jgi:hypothetical protein
MPSREWSLERLVNASTTGSQANSKVPALVGGGFVVVWEDGGSTAAIRAQRFDTAGNPVGDEIAIDTGLNEVLPSVADLADGGSAVTWTEDHTGNNYILGKLYSASGAVEHNQPVVFSFGPRRRLGRGVARRRIGGRSGPPASGAVSVSYRLLDATGTGGSIATANNPTAAQQNGRTRRPPATMPTAALLRPANSSPPSPTMPRSPPLTSISSRREASRGRSSCCPIAPNGRYDGIARGPLPRKISTRRSQWDYR